jgi:hypothetical protein
MFIFDDVKDILPAAAFPSIEIVLRDIGDHISEAALSAALAGYCYRRLHHSCIPHSGRWKQWETFLVMQPGN